MRASAAAVRGRLAITRLVNALRARDLDRVEELLDEVAAHPPPEDLGGRAWELACRASAAHECGRVEQALVLIRRARGATRGRARHAQLHALLAVLAVTCRREQCLAEPPDERRLRRLLRLIEPMMKAVERRGWNELLVQLLTVKGELLLRRDGPGEAAAAARSFARARELTAGGEYPLQHFALLEAQIQALLERPERQQAEPVPLRELLDELALLARSLAHPRFVWAARVLRAAADVGAGSGDERTLAQLESCGDALRRARQRGEICRLDYDRWSRDLERHAAGARELLRVRLAHDVELINQVMRRVHSERDRSDLVGLAEVIGRELAAERAAALDRSGAGDGVGPAAEAGAEPAVGAAPAAPLKVVRAGRLVTRSPALRRILEQIERLSESTLPVLICGESGTGKELIARAVHDRSSRCEGPFVPVNCAAIPHDLLEAELFGHARGAFTGATCDKRGFFVEASGGTLFLDEIGDLPLALQAKLLRVLEDRVVTPLGRTRGVEVDFRVVAATHVDLGSAVAGGRFRSDLYYRMQGLELRIPPLRARREDLPLLVEHFLAEFRAARGLRAPHSLSASAWRALERYDWPGNVRELRHAILVAAELQPPGGGPIPLEALPPRIIEAARSAGLAGLCAGLRVDERLLRRLFGVVAAHGYKPVMEAVDRYILQRALEAHNGNQRAAARSISIRESTLRQKSRRMGVVRPRA